MQNHKKSKRAGRSIRLYLYILSLAGVFFASFAFFKTFAQNEAPVSQTPEESDVAAQGTVDQWVSHESLPEEAIHEGPLVLVNRKYPCKEYEEAAMLSVYNFKNSSYMVSDKNVSLRMDTIEALNRMLEEFEALNGKQDLLVCSGYRTFDYQKDLLSEQEEQEGAAASTWVATPGASEHHTGYAFDFNIFHPDDGTSESYTGTGVYSWINENAPRFGLVVRYETEKYEYTGIQYEPWHFRYVGVPHSLIMQQHSLCLEEYISYLSQYTAEGEHLFFTDEESGNQYEIYSVKGTEDIPIGENVSYTISGNNIDGCIVTLVK